MPCYHPITGYRTKGGQVVFSELRRHGEILKTQTIACGQCHGCRLEYSRGWAMRCVHEARLYKRNCFITLTYDDAHLPHRGQLTPKHFVDFMKRLRDKENYKVLRYYQAGEYGTQTWRPHYHAILFNHDWEDKQYLKTTGSKEKIYTSNYLKSLWPYGHSSTGNMTFESAAYVARYAMEKRTGEEAENYYKRIDAEGEYQLHPEYCTMSRRPGIGADWMNFYKGEIYNTDSIIINGKESNVPAYYDKLFNRCTPARMAELKEAREWNAYTRRDQTTEERLKASELIARAKIKQLERNLE